MKILLKEHNIFRDSVECSVDSNDMDYFNKNDTGDSQSMAEDCIDDKNLCNPLLIQNAMEKQLTELDDIQKKYLSVITNT